MATTENAWVVPHAKPFAAYCVVVTTPARSPSTATRYPLIEEAPDAVDGDHDSAISVVSTVVAVRFAGFVGSAHERRVLHSSTAARGEWS
jgi:hypothetical protein